MALLLRNASMASSRGGSVSQAKAKTAKAKAKAKAARGRAKREKAAKGKAGKERMGRNCEEEEGDAPRRKVKAKPLEDLMSWQFVRSMCLWTRVVTSVPSLKPLAYPLFMVILGAVKSLGGAGPWQRSASLHFIACQEPPDEPAVLPLRLPRSHLPEPSGGWSRGAGAALKPPPEILAAVGR